MLLRGRHTRRDLKGGIGGKSNQGTKNSQEANVAKMDHVLVYGGREGRRREAEREVMEGLGGLCRGEGGGGETRQRSRPHLGFIAQHPRVGGRYKLV